MKWPLMTALISPSSYCDLMQSHFQCMQYAYTVLSVYIICVCRVKGYYYHYIAIYTSVCRGLPHSCHSM